MYLYTYEPADFRKFHEALSHTGSEIVQALYTTAISGVLTDLDRDSKDSSESSILHKELNCQSDYKREETYLLFTKGNYVRLEVDMYPCWLPYFLPSKQVTMINSVSVFNLGSSRDAYVLLSRIRGKVEMQGLECITDTLIREFQGLSVSPEHIGAEFVRFLFDKTYRDGMLGGSAKCCNTKGGNAR